MAGTIRIDSFVGDGWICFICRRLDALTCRMEALEGCHLKSIIRDAIDFMVRIGSRLEKMSLQSTKILNES